MPEHFHILVGEPKAGALSIAMQVLKQRVSRKCRRPPEADEQTRRARAFWQIRYYDFNVYSGKKKIQKLQYIHRNPVTRGLGQPPEQWRWSSYRWYRFGEKGPVKIGD